MSGPQWEPYHWLQLISGPQSELWTGPDPHPPSGKEQMCGPQWEPSTAVGCCATRTYLCSLQGEIPCATVPNGCRVTCSGAVPNGSRRRPSGVVQQGHTYAHYRARSPMSAVAGLLRLGLRFVVANPQPKTSSCLEWSTPDNRVDEPSSNTVLCYKGSREQSRVESLPESALDKSLGRHTGEDGSLNTDSHSRELMLIVRPGRLFRALLLAKQHGGGTQDNRIGSQDYTTGRRHDFY
ncbi:hypothetical protein C8R48DRAFT_677408 [Suillus tomentosus]|nr:hypothetical protein C8R48DRAFT_677408 [Suillus tomentosus]